MVRIAVPSRDGLVDAHFGHCKEFIVFAIGDDGSLSSETALPAPAGCGCRSGVAADLAGAGVTHLVAGNMGDGAVRVLSAHGIGVTRGISGDARKAALDFAAGKLADSGAGCSSHGHGHECSHGV
jgi:predicted Fe-Mo cluster-binding NifX family protein